MVLVAVDDQVLLHTPGNEPFPHEVEFVISALEAGPRPMMERQREPRTTYRVRATLKLFSDPRDNAPHLLFTRHVNTRAIGFLVDRPITLSHGGILRLPAPDGKILKIACTVLRCREATPGWFEGAMYFNLQQPIFSAEQLAETHPKRKVGRKAGHRVH